MDESFSFLSGSNPFSTRFTAPGKTPFFFDESLINRIKTFYPDKFNEFLYDSMGQNEDLQQSVCVRFLIDRFASHSCRGQIVGNHGTGKSTLVAVLKEAMIKQGYEIFSWSLHDQTRFLPDVFWSELQKFLQSIPVLLPTKYLLPPPVVSPEEYLSQQRDFLKDIFPEKNPDIPKPLSEISDPVEESFQVGEDALLAMNNSESLDSFATDEPIISTDSSNSPTDEAPDGFFGFNEAGIFGLRSGRLASIEPNNVFHQSDVPVKFAPFPSVDTASEPVSDLPKDVYDDVKLANLPISERDESTSSATPQKKLELPLNFDYASEKKRSFFDKKVLVFDGFEQLSFANRIILRTFCRMNRLGLLLTTHVPVIGVPVLHKTEPSVYAIHQLLDYLLEDYDDFQIDDCEIEILLKNFRNDIREMLFRLYDAFESYRLAPRDIREKIVRRYPR